MRAPIVLVFTALAAGVLASDALAMPAAVWGVMAALSLLLLAVAVRRRYGVVVAALLAFTTAGGLAAAWHRAPVTLATCADPSALWRLEVAGPVSRVPAGEQGVWVRVDVEAMAERCGDVWQPRRGRLRVTLKDGPAVVRGDVIAVRLAVQPFAARRNPTEIEPVELARHYGWAARAQVRSHHVLIAPGRGPVAVLDRWRQATASRYEQILQPTSAPLAKALGVGDQGAIALAQRDRWAAAGTAHLLSVSGLHVALIVMLTFTCLRWLIGAIPGAAERMSVRRGAALATLPVLAAFCVWTGAPVPAIRAAVMAGAYLFGVALLRPSSGANALGLAGAGLLLIDPTSLYDPSFLLSFAAVAALLLAPRLEPSRNLRERVRRIALGSLIASGAATVATAPITAYHFGQISLAAPLVNLVAVPLGAAVATPLALLFAALAPLADWLALSLGWLLDHSLFILDALATWVAASGWAAADVPTPRPWEIAAYFALVAGVVGLRSRPAYRHLLWVGLLVLAGSVIARVNERRGDGGLRVMFPYVGQGDAAVVMLPRGGVMVVDAGGSYLADDWDPGRTVLAPLLRRLGIRTIDLAVVTHPHPDHVSGFAFLAQRFRIREVWWNGQGEEVPAQAELNARVREAGGRVRFAAELPRVSDREGVTVEVLHPRPRDLGEGLPYYPALNANDNSIVLRLEHRGRSLLLAGDVEREAEALLVAELRTVDVLKAPHHGSRSSSTPRFLAATDPLAVVISCGENNHFGFPHPDVLARYAERGMQVLRTDLHGMLTFTADRAAWSVKRERSQTVDSLGARP